MDYQQNNMEGYNAQGKPPVSKLAVVGLILGVLSILMGLLWAGIYFGIPGLIISIIALIKIGRQGLSGKGIAIGGVITSVISLLGTIIFVCFFAAAVAPTMNRYVDKSQKVSDIVQATTISNAVNAALTDENAQKEMALFDGARITVTKGDFAVLPDSFISEYEANMGDSAYLTPSYTDDGAIFFVVEFSSENGCEAVYVYDGMSYIEVYPNADGAYKDTLEYE